MSAPEKPAFAEKDPQRQQRYFPGWTMLGIAAAAQFMSAPGQSYSVAAFKEPMRSSLGVSETGYSLAYATATIVSGLLLPLVGRLIDRHGARRTRTQPVCARVRAAPAHVRVSRSGGGTSLPAHRFGRAACASEAGRCRDFARRRLRPAGPRPAARTIKTAR